MEEKKQVINILIKDYEKDLSYVNAELSSIRDKKEEIIELLTNHCQISSHKELDVIEGKLLQACINGDLELIKIFLSETIEDEKNYLTFKINKTNKTASLLKINKQIEHLIVPRTVKHESEEYLITSICWIGSYHYSDLNIKTIKFDEDSSVTTIYSHSFSSSKIEEIYIPPSVSKIYEYAFEECKYLKKIKIPTNSNLQTIERYAFLESNIEEFFIPPSVSRICENAFYRFTNLKKIEIPTNSNLQTIERYAFSGLNIEEICFPPSVSRICEYAFSECRSLKKVKIPTNSNLQIIERYAFSKTNIEEIYIPPSISKIYDNAFSHCFKLKKVEIPTNSNLQTIERNAFSFSKIEEIYFPKNLKELKEGWCCNTCNLKKIIISPSNNQFIFKDDKYLIGKSDNNNDEFDILLFVNPDLKEIFIPTNIKIISSYAFSYSNIEEIYIPPNVSKICEYAFSFCTNLKKVEIPTNSNLKTIERNAFSSSNIKKISIPQNVLKELKGKPIFDTNNIEEEEEEEEFSIKNIEFDEEFGIKNVAKINLEQFILLDQNNDDDDLVDYKIWCPKTKKIYAAKRLKLRSNALKYTIEIQSQLYYPSIVKCIGYSPFDFKNRSNPVIVTEFYQNGTLNEILGFERKGKQIEGWDMTTKLVNIYGIASAMSYLHSLGIIHRDLNPGNVFVDDSLFPKLGNFYAAIKLSDLKHNKDLIGTPSYIAPEIYREQIYSKASDVYAFGITIYEIITGLKTFENMEYTQIMFRITRQKERPKFTMPIPQIYKDLIEQCWNEDPNERPSFEAIVNRLKNEEDFITEDVDADKYRSYIKFINNEVEGIEPTDKPKPIVTEDQQANIYRKLQSIIEEYRKIEEEEKKQIVESLPKEAEIDLNQFEKIEKIGKGGFGKVYRIMHKETQINYAAKTVTRKENENIFLRELKILSDLKHPSIEKFVGYSLVDFKKKPRLVIVTEYMSNQSLTKLLKEEPECLTNTIKLINIYGVASTINYLHSLDILHLDINPNNILENDYLFPKICDFGLSLKILDNQKIKPNSCGTPLYMSPEKIKEGASSKEVDIYAFGMLLHEMKTTKHPFNKYNPAQIMYIGTIDKITDKIDKTIPKVYLELIESCLDIDPSKRKPIEDIVSMLRKNEKFLEDDVDRELYQKYIWMIDEELKGRDTTSEIKNAFKQYTIYVEEDNTISYMTATNDVTYDEMEETRQIFEDEISNTFEFRHKETGQTFSVTKSQYYSRCKKEELEAKLKAEVEKLSKLDHPTIPKFYGFVLQRNKYQQTSNIITENLSIKRLFDVFEEERQGKHSTEWTMTNRQKMIYGIASGLSYLHSNGIYILQLNPKNVLVDSNYEVKLSEIGKFVQSDKTKMSSSIFDCSLFYLAPEQLTYLSDFDDKSDVYSFSLIVYEIITNKPVFPSKTPSILISKIVRDNYRPPFDDQIPSFYWKLLKRCWSSNPEERPPFEQIIQELENSKELISPDVNNDEYLRYQQFLKQAK